MGLLILENPINDDMELKDDNKLLSEYNVNDGAYIYLYNSFLIRSLFPIFIKMDGTYFMLNVEGDSTIKWIKQKIKDKENTDIEHQRLFFDHKALNDEQCTLNELGIVSLNVLCLVKKRIKRKENKTEMENKND